MVRCGEVTSLPWTICLPPHTNVWRRMHMLPHAFPFEIFLLAMLLEDHKEVQQLQGNYPRLQVGWVAGDAGFGFEPFLHTVRNTLQARRVVDLRAHECDQDRQGWGLRGYDNCGRPLQRWLYAPGARSACGQPPVETLLPPGSQRMPVYGYCRGKTAIFLADVWRNLSTLARLI